MKNALGRKREQEYGSVTMNVLFFLGLVAYNRPELSKLL